MAARIIDGKQIAKELRLSLKSRVAAVAEKRGTPPGLTAVLVGEDPASATYVRMKEKRAAALGIHGVTIKRDADISQDALMGLIAELNADPSVDGILVQRPLPPQIDVQAVSEAIVPDKDVDAFHPVNVGGLVQNKAGIHLPCTPAGIIELLKREEVPLQGKRAVVVGRSDIVGKPIALLLLHRHCTVTICHSRTADLKAEVGNADIVVAAVGKIDAVPGEWIREGAVVIDVGVNRREDGSLTGDVGYEAAAERASAITPVPGGVGPMTIAMLLSNTVDAAERRLG